LLYPSKIKAFLLFSLLIHVAFAAFFGTVNLSFPPPDMKNLSLSILTRGAAQSEVVQSTAVWPMPVRTAPRFSAEEVLGGFDADIGDWTRFGVPDPGFFAVTGTLVPHMNVAELAGELYAGPPEELYSPLPAESKAMPIAGFAVGLAISEIFEND
jgi:hypothetical protein